MSELAGFALVTLAFVAVMVVGMALAHAAGTGSAAARRATTQGERAPREAASRGAARQRYDMHAR